LDKCGTNNFSKLFKRFIASCLKKNASKRCVCMCVCVCVCVCVCEYYVSYMFFCHFVFCFSVDSTHTKQIILLSLLLLNLLLLLLFPFRFDLAHTQKRPSAQRLLKHKFIKQHAKSPEYLIRHLILCLPNKVCLSLLCMCVCVCVLFFM